MGQGVSPLQGLGPSATELTPKQHRALIALLETGNVTEAARVAKIGRTTIYEYLKDPSFVGALESLQTAAMQITLQRLANLGNDAVDALGDALSEGEDARTRVRAADVVLGRFLSLFDAANTARRIAEMGDELDELKDKVA